MFLFYYPFTQSIQKVSKNWLADIETLSQCLCNDEFKRINAQNRKYKKTKICFIQSIFEY